MNSSFLLSITTFAYLGCAILYLISLIFRLRPLLRVGSWVGILTLALHTVGLLFRWRESYALGFGHAPLSNLYESLVFGAWAVMVIYFIVEYKTAQRALGIVPSFLAFLAMAYASFSPDVNSRIQPLVPALKSNWLIAHVLTCFLGYAAFAISFGISLIYVLRYPKDEEDSSSFLPNMQLLDELNYQMILFGFFLLSLGIVTGAVWADSAWGSYWSWDPKETWSLITWLIYAALLHLRALRGWRGKQIAWLSMIGFASVMFTYLGVNFLLSGLHSYASS